MLSLIQLCGGGGPAGPLCLLPLEFCPRGQGIGVSGTLRIAFNEGCTVGRGLVSSCDRSAVGRVWLRRRCWRSSLTFDAGLCD